MGKSSQEKQDAHNRGQEDFKKCGGHADSNPITEFFHPSYKAPSDSELNQQYKDGWNNAKEQSSSSSSSCCHITTACLDAIGKPRNSLEMMAMEELAREYTLKSFRGKRDYVLYRRNAPALVKAISERSDAREIWGRVYEKLRRVTSTVLSKDYTKAQEQYRELVVGLESKYA